MLKCGVCLSGLLRFSPGILHLKVAASVRFFFFVFFFIPVTLALYDFV